MFKVNNLKFKDVFQINNLEISKEQPIVIFGESGSGKTSFIKILIGEQREYIGNVFYKDNDLKAVDLQILREEVMYVTTENIFFKATIKEEITYICHLLNVDYNEKRLKELLKDFYLDKPINEQISLLSNGQKQRLKLVRSLYYLRECYILDEPISGLDGETKVKIINRLKEYSDRYKILLIIITHDQTLIRDEFFQKINFKDFHE